MQAILQSIVVFMWVNMIGSPTEGEQRKKFYYYIIAFVHILMV